MAAYRIVVGTVYMFFMAHCTSCFSFNPSFALGKRRVQLSLDAELRPRVTRKCGGLFPFSMQSESGDANNRANGGEEKLRLWKEKAKAARKPSLQQGVYISILCVLGISLTAYALHVEHMLRLNKSYKAACDVGSWASCSNVAKSAYGSGLGIISKRGPFGFLAFSNPIYGLVFYLAMLGLQAPPIFASPRARIASVVLASVSLFASAWLGYLLFAVIKEICIVCISSYVLNVLIFVLTMADYRKLIADLKSRKPSSA
uniref:vitamin-K-epoxide reductase (warfarin-sensitive) n=1 Tax=Guillardia theta TaxID=55529 RepID=A0A6U6E2H1_GUITH